MPHTLDPYKMRSKQEFYSFFQPAIESKSQMKAFNRPKRTRPDGTDSCWPDHLFIVGDLSSSPI